MTVARELQEGWLDDFKAHPPTAEQLQWAHPASNDKITGVIIPLGYTQEEVQHPEFQALYAEIIGRFNEDFSPELFNIVLYTGKEPELSIEAWDEHYLRFSRFQLHWVKQRLSEIGGASLDNLHFLVNPDAFDSFHAKERGNKQSFGYATTFNTVNAGPYADEGKWKIASISTLAHEMGHALSFQQISLHDPVSITDYYTRKKLYPAATDKDLSEVQFLKQSCHSEYFLEDPRKPGQPLPSASFCITKALEKTKPLWHDTGLTFEDTDTGIIHRILAPHDGKGLMSGGFTQSDGRTECPPATEFHKALFEIGAELHLAHTGRKHNPELLQEHAAFQEKQKSHEFASVQQCEIQETTQKRGLLDRIKTWMRGENAPEPTLLPPTYNFKENRTQQETYFG